MAEKAILISRCTRTLGIVLLVLAIPALLGTIALGTDAAMVYSNSVRLQKAANAAVVAGARFLPSNPQMAVITANRFAQLNGARPSEIVSTQLSLNDRQIQIRLARTIPYYFIWLVGLSAGMISVSATASVPASGSAGQLIPAGIP
jgi:Putative Flp pilus-assembly TadE/G-like